MITLQEKLDKIDADLKEFCAAFLEPCMSVKEFSGKMDTFREAIISLASMIIELCETAKDLGDKFDHRGGMQ